MAVEAAHLLKAKSNREFLDTIEDRYPEWLVTVAFYTSVHLVEAVFARENFHSHGHVERNERLQDFYEKLWNEFKPLYDQSVLVRYSPRGISAKEARELIETRLGELQRLVQVRLSAPAASATITKKA